MVIPDWLFKIFAAIGLVDSEEKKINKMVAGCKDELRRLRSLLEEQITEVANIEREIKKLQPKYEEAQGPAKGAYAEMIKPLLQKRAAMNEKQLLVSENIKTVTAMLTKLENLRDVPATPGRTDTLENLISQMQDLNDDMRDQRKALNKLESIRFDGPASAAPDLSEFTDAAPKAQAAADDPLAKELAEICGTAPAASKGEEKIEA